MKYVDGYVLPVPVKKLKAYARMALKAGKVWRDTAPSTTRSALATIRM
jgi:uncharacterized protein YbaA (DUF1428 family)